MEKKISEVEKRALAVVASLGLTVNSAFVPFSQSRNKANKDRSLNWRVTLMCNGRAVLTTDYSAGIAHCPSYHSTFGKVTEYAARTQRELIEFETEKGFRGWYAENIDRVMQRDKTPILPGVANVVSSLVLDSDVINYSSFEDWANNLGFDADSRSAEKSYRACLETGLAMRNAIGDTGLAALADAFSEF